ncbi:hypothetical protein ES704_02178 [subsurface metagenome]
MHNSQQTTLKALMTPPELKANIKKKAKDYLTWIRRNSDVPIPEDQYVLSSKYDFDFSSDFRHLNFHPGIMEQAKDLLTGRVDRRYNDASSDIAIHDYVGHIASSQALCWNVVMPMKKHDNFTPLFEVLSSAFQEGGLDSEFDFGIETSVVLELNVGEDLGEGRLATSIDLYLRTPQGKVCAVEFKLTEDDFGKCKLPKAKKCDGSYGSPKNIGRNNGHMCYLARIGRRYWQLGGQYNLLNPTRVNDPCPLNEYYQALRNLMVAKKRAGESLGKEVRGIFVLAADERNSAFWGSSNRFDSLRNYLNEVREEYVPDVFRISTQDIVRGFSGSLEGYKEYFAVKYGY